MTIRPKAKRKVVSQRKDVTIAFAEHVRLSTGSQTPAALKRLAEIEHRASQQAHLQGPIEIDLMTIPLMLTENHPPFSKEGWVFEFQVVTAIALRPLRRPW